MARELYTSSPQLFTTVLVFKEGDHEGDANGTEPTEYMIWITLFQSTLGFFTPTMAEDLL